MSARARVCVCVCVCMYVWVCAFFSLFFSWAKKELTGRKVLIRIISSTDADD